MLDHDQIRTCAAFFASYPSAEGVYIWEDGTAHAGPRPGADLAFYVPREAALPHSRRGEWGSQVEFLDKLDAEDRAWNEIWSA